MELVDAYFWKDHNGAMASFSSHRQYTGGLRHDKTLKALLLFLFDY